MIKKMNTSYKAKDKFKFLDEVTNIYRHFLKEKPSNPSKSIMVKSESTSSSSPSPSKKISRAFTFDNLDSMTIDFNNLIEDVGLFSVSSIENSHKSSILNDPILSKNINIIDEVMKFMIIGDVEVGKSYFIDKCINSNSGKKPYVPTSSFGIKKKNIRLLDKHIQIEFWDTNSEILNSEISKGRYII